MIETAPTGGISLLAGVISSLIAVFLVEMYRLFRQIFVHRALKRVLGLRSRSCTVVAPIFNNPALSDEWFDRLIHYRDAYAFSHLFSLCQLIGVEASLVPYNKVSEYLELSDTFCVGGPVSNELTSYYLSRYVPGVRMVNASREEITSWQEGGGFMMGKSGLFEKDGDQFAILIKITEQDLGQRRTVHLLFGYGAMATAAAGYYLWKHYVNIHAKKGLGRYCIAVRLVRGEGYKSVRVDFEDYTDAAFAKPSVP